MSLNWNIENCNLDADWKKDNWNTIERVIFSTMSVDIGEIKEANLKEFEFRLRVVEKVTDFPSSSDIGSILSILPKLIGLKTNVITTTRQKFMKRVMNNIEADVNYRMSVIYKTQKETV